MKNLKTKSQLQSQCLFRHCFRFIVVQLGGKKEEEINFILH